MSACVKGPAGRGHLGTARHGAEDRLVVAERVAPVEVAVRDRSTVPAQVRPEIAVGPGPPRRLPRPVGDEPQAGVRLDQGQGGAPGEELLAWLGVQHRTRGIGRGPYLDHPVVGRTPMVPSVLGAARLSWAAACSTTRPRSRDCASQAPATVAERLITTASPGCRWSGKVLNRVW